MSFTIPTMDPDPRDPKVPLVYAWIDNTTLQTAMHCWRHYYYSSVLGLKPKPVDGPVKVVESVHLTFGSLIHEGADVYCKLTARGVSPEDATIYAVDQVLSKSWPMGAERDVFGGRYVQVWQCKDRTKTVKKTGVTRCPYSKTEHLCLTEEHASGKCFNCGRDVERRTAYHCDEKYKNRRTLVRAMVALCDHFTESSLKVVASESGGVASEMRFYHALRVNGLDGNPIVVTGSFDSVAQDGTGRHIIREYKTTKRQPNQKFWDGYEMSPQVHTYSWAAMKEFGIGAQVHVYAIHIGVNFVEIYVKPVPMTYDKLEEWQNDMEAVVQESQVRAGLAIQLAQKGQDPINAYRRNLAACGSLPGASTTPCPFRDFCRLPPVDRQHFLESNFVQEPWNFLETKGTAETEE